jgi:hypothetical protein
MGEAIFVLLTRNLDSAEAGQVAGGKLRIEQDKAAVSQALHQMD